MLDVARQSNVKRSCFSKHKAARFESRWCLPSPNDVVVEGVVWGSPDVLFTPAYWKYQSEDVRTAEGPNSFRLTTCLRSECVLCILGGYGIPAEIGLSAFSAIEDSGLLEKAIVDEEDVYSILSLPIKLPSGREQKYRFAKQKSKSIAEFLNRFREPVESDPIAIRHWLTEFRGIGLKTASWIVRNWYGSDAIAILDIHIHRAGLLIGLFDSDRRLSVASDYLELENRFVSFSNAIGVKTSILDSIIWDQMRNAGTLVHKLLTDYNAPALGK